METKKSILEKIFEAERLNTIGYSYRTKILFGEIVILKETIEGKPVKKYFVDSFEDGNNICDRLNKIVIIKAHDNITKYKKHYAPNVHEIQTEVNKINYGTKRNTPK